MTQSELKPEKYRRAEIRAAVNAANAKTSGEAYDFKLQQLANHHLYNVATKAKATTTSQLSYIKSAGKRKYNTKTIAAPYVGAIRGLYRAYDFSSTLDPDDRTRRFHEFLNFLQSQRDAGVDVVLRDVNVVELQNGAKVLPAAKELTVDQIQGIYEQIKHLNYVGRQQADSVKAEVLQSRNKIIEAVKASGKPRSDTFTPGWLERWKYAASKFGYDLISTRNFARTMDNDPDIEGGVIFDEIYKPLHEADSNKLALTQRYYAKFKELMGDNDITLINDNSKSVRTVVRADGSNWRLSSRQRMMLALYWGTETSRQRVTDGFNVTEAEVHEMMSHMSEQELNMVKAVWEHSNYMKPEVFKTTVDREGVPPTTLDSTPFVVNGVQMPGGHMRIFYNNYDSPAAQKVRLDTDALSMVNSVTPSLAASAQERAQTVNHKLSLDPNNIFRNIEENVHFIAMSEVGARLQSVLNNKEVQATIAEYHGPAFRDALLQNVQGITTNYREAEPSELLAKAVKHFRSTLSSQHLMYNLGNIMLGTASTIPAVDQVGPVEYSKSMQRLTFDYENTVSYIESKSPAMRARKTHLTREHADAMRNIRSGSKLEKTVQDFSRAGFKMHVLLDQMVGYPVWDAVYRKGMNDHGNESRAIVDADTLVAEVVGSGHGIHMGNLFQEGQPSYIQMLTIFQSFFNSGPTQRVYKATRGEGRKLPPASIRALVIVPMGMAIMANFVASNIPKGAEEDDSWWKWAGLSWTGFLGAMIPILGDLMPAQEVYRPSTIMEDAVAATQNLPGLLSNIAEGEMEPLEATEAILRVIATFVKAPGSGEVIRMIDYQQSVGEGDAQPILENPLKLYPALVEGADKNPR
jgi:hypothetical protein